MTILLTENPGYNSYINSLIIAYQKAGHTVICGSNNFFWSDFKPDILHIHWPERLYKWYVLKKEDKQQLKDIEKRLRWYRQNGSKIIYTVHNLLPHNTKAPENDSKFYNLIIEYADLIHHHCPKSIDLVAEKFPAAKEKPNIVANHGDYLIDYRDVSKETARRTLGIPQKSYVILNFGSQQSYKGNSLINKTFSKLEIKNKFLLTAGNFRYDTFPFPKNYILKVLNRFRMKSNSTTKKYILQPVPPEEIAVIFGASDIVILGHSSGLTSGVLNLAATFSKPVVFPDIGCFEYQMDKWIYEKYPVGNIQKAKTGIEKIHEKYYESTSIPHNSDWLKTNSWNNYVNTLLNKLN